MDHLARYKALKEKIRKGEPTLGMFVRTPASSVVELLGGSGFEFIVLDAEHAPFSTPELDQCLLAARAADLPAIVRVPGANSPMILNVLDLGAAGIMVPHVDSAKEATQAVAATSYVQGTRGFSGATRAGNYGGIPGMTYKDKADESVTVLGQIEDGGAVERIDEIASVASLDALFIGPFDLSVSLGANSVTDPKVDTAIDKVCKAGAGAGRTVGLFLPSTENLKKYRDKGISLFAISTDQGLLAKAATALANDAKDQLI